MSKPPPPKFALIGHPMDLQQFRSYISFLKPDKTYRDELILKLFEWTPSYKVKEWQDYTLNGKTVADGMMIMVPFLPEMKDIKFNQVVQKIEDAFKIASDHNCTVVALGAFTSIILQGKEKDYSSKFSLKLTSGNTFTTALIIQSVMEICDKTAIPLSEITMAVIGASGDIGSGCVLYFGDKVKKLHLSARGIPRLESFLHENKNQIKTQYQLFTNNQEAVKGASIVICVTSSYHPIFTPDDFDPYTIVCDASAPLNVTIEPDFKKEDLFVYHGGIVKLPYPLETGFDIGIPATTMYGCMTEGVLNAFYELPPSWGRGNISRDKIQNLLNFLSPESPLKVAFSSGKTLYTEQQINQLLLPFKDNYRKKI